MKKLFGHQQYAYVALLIWFIASLSGMHGHYCFDGAEPSVSVHFDLMHGPDVDHDVTETMHIDVDNNPAQTTAIKILGFDFHFLAIALLFVFIWPIVRGQKYDFFRTPLPWLSITNLRPPLRAPPKDIH